MLIKRNTQHLFSLSFVGVTEGFFKNVIIMLGRDGRVGKDKLKCGFSEYDRARKTRINFFRLIASYGLFSF